MVDITGNAIKEGDSSPQGTSALSKILELRKRRQGSAITRSHSIDSADESVKETGNGRFVIDDMQGGYRFIYFSKKSCLLSAHIKVFGKHIKSSPSNYFFAALGSPRSLFSSTCGHVLYSSSVHVINGWPDANSPENLRQMNTSAGWLTDGQGTETVVIGFDGIVSLYQIHFLNWAARK